MSPDSDSKSPNYAVIYSFSLKELTLFYPFFDIWSAVSFVKRNAARLRELLMGKDTDKLSQNPVANIAQQRPQRNEVHFLASAPGLCIKTQARLTGDTRLIVILPSPIKIYMPFIFGNCLLRRLRSKI